MGILCCGLVGSSFTCFDLIRSQNSFGELDLLRRDLDRLCRVLEQRRRDLEQRCRDLERRRRVLERRRRDLERRLENRLGDLDGQSGDLDLRWLLLARDLFGDRVDVSPGEDPSVSLEELGEDPEVGFFVELGWIGEGDGVRVGETGVPEIETFGRGGDLAAALVEGSLDRGEGALIGENFRDTFKFRTLYHN
eukprot:sb/3471019/